MRPASFIASFAVLSLTCLVPACASAPSETGPARAVTDEGAINTVILDESFLSTFGRDPNAGDEGPNRIATHLRYIEGELRSRDVSHLSEPLRAARVKNLNRLHDYWMAGVFPRNPVGTGRLPRFVEPAGGSVDEPRRVCAVGAMAEHDLGAAAIDAIGAKFEHALVYAIDDAAFTAWASTSGLMLEELAMIQPSYHWMERPIDDEGALTAQHVHNVLIGKNAEVNACVHAALGPRDAHPAKLSATVRIATDGHVTSTTVRGTDDAGIRACAEKEIAKAAFRSARVASTHTMDFTIQAPRNADGTLNNGYVPVVFYRTEAAVNACGALMPKTSVGALRLGVKVRYSGDGTRRVFAIAPDMLFEVSPSAEARACVVRAIESRDTPTFEGADRDFEWFYVMKTPK